MSCLTVWTLQPGAVVTGPASECGAELNEGLLVFSPNVPHKPCMSTTHQTPFNTLNAPRKPNLSQRMV